MAKSGDLQCLLQVAVADFQDDSLWELNCNSDCNIIVIIFFDSPMETDMHEGIVSQVRGSQESFGQSE